MKQNWEESSKRKTNTNKKLLILIVLAPNTEQLEIFLLLLLLQHQTKKQTSSGRNIEQHWHRLSNTGVFREILAKQWWISLKGRNKHQPQKYQQDSFDSCT